MRIAAKVAASLLFCVISRVIRAVPLLEFSLLPAPLAMAPRSRSRSAARESAALAAAETALRAERARAAELDARWLAAYQDVVDDARALAALARGAGAGGEVVDDWFVAPPAPAEPEEEPPAEQ